MPKTPRKHICSTCSRAYAKAEHLVRHERTHTGDKPYTCLSCLRNFSRQDSLVRHQQRQNHEGILSSSAEHLNSTFNVTDTNQATCSLDVIQTQSFLENSTATVSQLQPFENVLSNDSTDDFFLPLTWPDSEELLQSILTSNLGPWSENIELLPTQHLLNGTTQGLLDSNSPWLPQNSNQQPENGNQAIRNVSQIISDLSANVTLEAESATLSTVFLDACLHMFFDQFTCIFPVCHRPTFVFREWTHPLLLNAIALGSLFVGHKVNIAKGEVLWKLAHTAVATSWHSLILHRGSHDPSNGIQLVLTALLGQTYAMLSSTARLRSTAQIFHSLGFYWARQCDMYSYKRKFRPTDAINAGSNEERLESWKSWAAEETELRALLGHYILDGQLPYFTGAPTCQRHASNPLPLPCSDSLFQASVLDDWIALLEQERTTAMTFRQLLYSIFSSPADVLTTDSRYSPLTVSVVIEGLESFVTEANSVEGDVVGNPSRIAISSALGSVYNYISRSDHFATGEKTEMYLRWHVVGIDAAINFNSLCRSMCSYFSVDQAVFGQLKKNENSIDFKKWIESAHARRALLHAIAIWETLAHLPLNQACAIHVPVAIFIAATTYCAFVMAGSTTIVLPSTVDWNELMSTDLDSAQNVMECGSTQVANFLSCASPLTHGSTKNLLYDSNVFLMRLRQIQRPWGICTSLENILQQWLTKCGM